MKAYTLLVLVPLALSSPLILAAEEPKHHMQSQSSMGMSQTHIDQMEAHMKDMKKEMAEIRQIKDTNKRKARLQKHMQSMANMMQEMHKMRPEMSSSETTVHLQMIEKRVDLLQDFFNLMLQSQLVKEGLFYKTYD
jgi:phage shock protein A